MKTKKIALFTSKGLIGQNIVKEALSRGHRITVIMADIKGAGFDFPGITLIKGDVNKSEDVFRNAKDHDLVIYDQELEQNKEGECFNATRSVIIGCKTAGIKRLIISGRIHPYKLNLTKEERDSWRPVQEEQLAALGLLQREPDIDWSYFYTVEAQLTKKSNRYLSGIDNDLIFALPNKEVAASMKEYAEAILDEAEKNENIQAKPDVVSLVL